jgi:hypothetical protein
MPRQSMPLRLYGRGEPVKFVLCGSRSIWILYVGCWARGKTCRDSCPLLPLLTSADFENRGASALHHAYMGSSVNLDAINW